MLGLEFLPKLEEGNLWIRATLPPTISLQEGNAYVNEMRRMIRARPEVESVVSQHGRPDDADGGLGVRPPERERPVDQEPGEREGDGEPDQVGGDVHRQPCNRVLVFRSTEVVCRKTARMMARPTAASAAATAITKNTMSWPPTP